MSTQHAATNEAEVPEHKGHRRPRSDDSGLCPASILNRNKRVKVTSDWQSGHGSRTHSLISAMSKLEGAHGEQRSAVIVHSRKAKPLYSLTRNPWGLADALDSLARLLVSKPRGERFALTLRIHKAPGTLGFYIAGSEPVGKDTVERLVKIWTDLGQYSAEYFRSWPAEAFTPRSQYNTPPRMSDMTEQIELDALRWAFAKLQKRMNSPRSKHVVLTVPPHKEHPFAAVRTAFINLQNLYTTNDNPLIGRPASETVGEWRQIWHLLREIRKGHKAIAAWGNYTGSIRRFLIKVVEVVEETRKLIRAAMSPPLAHLFQFKIHVTVLDVDPMADSVGPDTAVVCTQLLEQSVQDHDKRAPRRSYERPSLSDRSSSDAETSAIHPEMRMLIHCDAKNKAGAHIFTYIGLSKPCCRACCKFLECFNRRFGRKFGVYGSSRKMAWPWQFPVNCPGSALLEDALYQSCLKDCIRDNQVFCLRQPPDLVNMPTG